MGIIIESPVKPAHKPPSGRSGGNGLGHFTPNHTSLVAAHDDAPDYGSTAIWVGIAAIVMMFAALTSALVVRQGASTDWHHFDLPVIVYFNTVILLTSSFTLQIFVRNFRNMVSLSALEHHAFLWLYATLALGSMFVVGQYLAWRQLVGQGLYMASNPSHSFFYVLTGAHLLHLLGGVIALIYVARQFRRFALTRNTLGIVATYWHFMDLLWLYLLGLLWFKV